MNHHKNARLTFARRLAMVREIVHGKRSVAGAAFGAGGQ